MTKLSIVILSYNTKDLSVECVKSIESEYGKELAQKEIEIIVVDNNSSDGSAEKISGLNIPNLLLIAGKENLGFGKGCNLGAKNAKGKYILFLNSDTRVADHGFMKMVEFLDSNPKITILGGKLENPDSSAQPSAGKFYSLFNLFLMLIGLERFGFLRSSPNIITKVDWVSGACMLVNRQIFNELSGFDEKIFMYMEDMEICLRAKKAGYSVYFYPNLKLKHNSYGSSNKSFAIINIYKGILHFYSKHKSKLEYKIAKALLLYKAKILITIGFLTFNPGLVTRYKEAIRNL